MMFISFMHFFMTLYVLLMSSSKPIDILTNPSERPIFSRSSKGISEDVELPGGDVNVSDVQEKVNELEGVEQEYANDDTAHEILEMHINTDIPGFENENGISSIPWDYKIIFNSGLLLRQIYFFLSILESFK